GGKGAEPAKTFINEMLAARKPVTAVCLGPAILADAGALAGRKATCWRWTDPVDGVGALERGKATYLRDENLVQDGLIITARHPDAIRPFGERIRDILTKCHA